MKLKQFIAILLTGTFLTWAFPVKAEFLENIDYQRYPVMIPSGLSLLEAINLATPIREYGRKFHGYTKSSLRWNNRYKVNQLGLCEISTVTVTLSAVVVLPDINQKYPDLEKFSQYVDALMVHEIGHLNIGKSVGRKLERALKELPAMSNCQLMELSANSLGREHDELMFQQNRDYDNHTKHGATQGASLLND